MQVLLRIRRNVPIFAPERNPLAKVLFASERGFPLASVAMVTAFLKMVPAVRMYRGTQQPVGALSGTCRMV
jgi:hypothetical protein